MRSFFFLALVPLIIGCVACSGSSGGSVTSTSSASPSADLSGEWSGHATALGQTVPVSASLTQNGSSVSGSIRSPGGCIGGGKVDGTLSGDSLRANVTAGDVLAFVNLTISDDDQLDGTFDLPGSGACPAQQGSISLARK